ncbi:MAG TPA: dTDP-4-dehydrorhamnose reductase [Candidatus Brocadiia bacterium]|nr:dTDP-4-dehydrorhamnose reductase [Candidatus Brocadiales bacterium]
MRTLLIGANGQLGSDLRKALNPEISPKASLEDARTNKFVHATPLLLIPLTHADIEITDFNQVKEILERHRPDVVINTAAYNRVDDCEDNIERAFNVNAYGVRNLAIACKNIDATLVHFSTDYVFDGLKTTPYKEDDAPRPISVYGISKLTGEYFIRYILKRYFIIRTCGLYGIVRHGESASGATGSKSKGGNFVELMLRFAREGREIKVVNDQVLTPTSTKELARKVCQLIGIASSASGGHRNDMYGLYHITNNGACSWHEFAKEIFKIEGLSPVGARCNVPLRETTSEAYGARAKRPAYSVLDHCNLRKLGLDDMKDWKEALKTYLLERQKSPLPQPSPLLGEDR